MRRLAKPLKYHGGKEYLAAWTLEHFPPEDSFTHYSEPYFGGGSVLLERPVGKSESVNDINHHLINFWRVLQSPTLFAHFCRSVSAIPFSEVAFEHAVGTIRALNEDPLAIDAIEEVEAAEAFFVLCRQSRQGLMRDFATLSRKRTRRGINEQASSWLSAIEGLPEVHDRLSGIVITCKPALHVIRQQDDEQTLFYLDPPYLHETRVTTDDYEHEMTEGDHAELLEALSGIQGRFLLAGYPSDLYDEFARGFGWRRVEKEIDNKASGRKEKPKKRECLWMNFNEQGDKT